MFRIKKLDIFILKSFSLLFAGTFFICLFIFMMQFLWRYVDELVGKGLDMDILAQFFFYASLTLVPASLPLAVLLASLITFGNFGERFELLAMKAAGISLLKIIRPLVVMITFVCFVSFYFQNVIGPIAQTKLWTLLISMRQKSPELDIPEQTFYDQIDGYNLYVGHKDRDTGMLYDVLIYNFGNGFENATIIKADSGRLEMTQDKSHLYFRLYDGEQFENLQSQNMSKKNVPYRRESFSQKHALIDFNANFNMIDEGFMSNQSNSKNMASLQSSIDSMKVRVDSLSANNYTQVMSSLYALPEFKGFLEPDTVDADAPKDYNVDNLWISSTLAERQKYANSAMTTIQSAGSDWNFKALYLEQTKQSMRRHQTAWHEKITLSLACLIFFFIGAPLGSIIRKGGLGLPVVVSVIIFIFYYIVNNTGYKLARDGQWIPWAGMWLSTAVLAPMGAFLTYKSNNDSVVLNMDSYVALFKKIFMIKTQRNIFSKEVIIVDPDYRRLDADLEVLSQDCERYIENKKLKHAPNYITLWLNPDSGAEFDSIYSRLEAYVEEMSNTKDPRLLASVNKYPTLSYHSETRTFSKTWQNLLCGIVLPLGLIFYLRIWISRKRLEEDLVQVIAVNKEVRYLLNRYH